MLWCCEHRLYKNIVCTSCEHLPYFMHISKQFIANNIQIYQHDTILTCAVHVASLPLGDKRGLSSSETVSPSTGRAHDPMKKQILTTISNTDMPINMERSNQNSNQNHTFLCPPFYCIFYFILKCGTIMIYELLPHYLVR